MDRSRTPLSKWAAAVELLATTQGINATQLASGVGITHKAAWLMLRRFRHAIGEIESSRRLQGFVQAGLRALGPYPFMWSVYYSRERVILSCVARKSGEIKLRIVDPAHLNGKQVPRHGERLFLDRYLPSFAEQTTLLPSRQIDENPVGHRFEEAKRWLNDLFHGVGDATLQTYLDEFAFRWNVKISKKSAVPEWYRLCFHALPA